MKKNPKSNLVLLLSRNLRKLRIELNYSQEKLAEMCGYHRTYIGSIERGERNITLTTLEALSDALGVSPESLLLQNNNRKRGDNGINSRK